MPNWCNNIVNITHTDADMQARVRSAYIRGELLNEFIACPPAVRATQSVYYPDGHELHAAQLAREADNVSKYGFRNWYDWQIAHWGTKWDIGGSEDSVSLCDGVLTLSFDSAWSPPIEAYERLEELGFSIEAYYYEPGMAFCGSWRNGVDEYVEIPSKSQQAASVIPRIIDDMFDIVNNMAMWEEDEVEE